MWPHRLAGNTCPTFRRKGLVRVMIKCNNCCQKSSNFPKWTNELYFTNLEHPKPWSRLLLSWGVGTSFNDDLLVNPQGRQFQNLIFSPFHSTHVIQHCSSYGSKLRTAPLYLLFDTLPCRYLAYLQVFSPSGSFECLAKKGDSWKHKRGKNW